MKFPWLAAAAAAAGALAATVAQAQTRTGESVYKETCSACHAAGVANAPRFGDKAKWAPLIKEGQHVLTAHAWVGVRGMPARGGKPDLSQEDFARAVAYMAREAGGKWQDPDAKMMERIRKEEQKHLAKGHKAQ